MSKFVLGCIFLFGVHIVAAEEAYDCVDINIGSMGMAWDNGGNLVTGVVLCKNEREEIRSTYKEGLKHGVQVRKVNNVLWLISEKRHYRNGIAFKRCKEYDYPPHFSESFRNSCYKIDCAVEDCR